MQGTEAQVAPYAQYEASKYGITAALTVEKSQYAEKELARFSAFITNSNSFAVTVWGGCQATSVSTFSILRAEDGRSVYEWKPTGLTCNLLHAVTINATQSYQLAAIGLGKNLTWDQKSGTPESPGDFVSPGKYVIVATVDVVGFNPSETPCQPSGTDCDPSVDHSFSLHPTETITINSAGGVSEYGLSGAYIPVVAVASIIVALAAAISLRRRIRKARNVK